VSVTHTGWHGRITTFAAEQPTEENANVAVAVSSSALGDAPYYTSIYQGSTRVCAAFSSGCSGYVTVPAGQAYTLRAYVGPSAPTSGAPADAVTTSAIVVGNVTKDSLVAAPQVLTMASAVAARYGEQACLVLGEKARTHGARSSVPDVTLVCDAKGIVAALRLMAQLDMPVQNVLDSLLDGVEGDTPTSFHPDCGNLATDGTCLDEGTPRSEPEPEPAPAGGGIPLPPNCVTDAAALQDLRDALNAKAGVQDHHLATNKSPKTWTPRFEELLREEFPAAGLNLDQPWNHLDKIQLGNHPPQYHQWVLDNMRRAADQANGDPQVFKNLFEEWVKVPIDHADPLVLRWPYWACR
jgi:hypothetical protein